MFSTSHPPRWERSFISCGRPFAFLFPFCLWPGCCCPRSQPYVCRCWLKEGSVGDVPSEVGCFSLVACLTAASATRCFQMKSASQTELLCSQGIRKEEILPRSCLCFSTSFWEVEQLHAREFWLLPGQLMKGDSIPFSFWWERSILLFLSRERGGKELLDLFLKSISRSHKWRKQNHQFLFLTKEIL